MNLENVAHSVATQRGFEPDFNAEVEREVAAIRAPNLGTPPSGVRDLRQLAWSSIDNQESMDLDQIEVASRLPNDAIQILIGIADVDSLVPKGSAIDAHADHNCTSIYTGVIVFPMLPRKLSEDLSSLLPDGDRLAVVVELVVEQDGSVSRYDVSRALVRNRFKLVYESVGAWLERAEGAGKSGSAASGTALPPDVTDQLTLQREAAKRLKGERLRAGALELDTIEARPVMQNGKVVDISVTQKNLARDLIEDFMIAANIASAKFLEAHGSSGIRRVVREPERWARIVDLARLHGERLPDTPDAPSLAAFLSRMHAQDPLRFPDLSLSIVKLLGRGEYQLDLPGKDPGIHFGLAAHDYSHTTAPNRRYADLIQQRLMKAVLAGTPQPYTNDELAALASHATEMEDAAQKVERQMRKVIAAGFLKNKVGQTFDGIVTGASDKGTYVRLLQPPAEGRVVKAEEGMDVGDRVQVKLVGVNQERGFIDFAGTRR